MRCLITLSNILYTPYAVHVPYTQKVSAVPSIACPLSCLQGGAYASLAWEDLGRLLSVVDNVYDIQSFRVEFVLLKCNLPPRTVVR